MRNQLVRRPQNLLDAFFNDDVFPSMVYGRGIDIYRKDNTYVVEADLPGFEKEEIDIDYKGDVLTISAQHNESTENEDKNYTYRSRQSRRFMRQIRFNDIDAKGIEASYEKGVLSVKLPLMAATPDDARRIEVK